MQPTQPDSEKKGTTVRVVPITGGQRRFSAMVKPFGPACNLGCSYCYYVGKEKMLGLGGHRGIDSALLEKFIREFIEGNDAAEIVFEWQGGEPTLLGIDFFRTVIRLQQKYCPQGKFVMNNLQTNGTLLDREWCRFLSEHRFLVGLSVDGPRDLHDTFRRDNNGKPTFDRVVGAAKLLREHGVEFNTLTVVNRVNATRPLDVYRFLTQDIRPRIIQFIPCVEPKAFKKVAPWYWNGKDLPMVGSSASRPGNADSLVTDWTVDPEEFGTFLCRVFDEWYSRDIGTHFVNLFESFIAVWSGLPAQICAFHDFCGKSVMMERDGSIFSCDHFAYPEYRLGNLRTRSLAEMVFSERQVSFGFGKCDRLPRYCRTCPFLTACYGECPKNRFVRAPDGEPGLNYLCPGLKKYFTYADRQLQKLAREFGGSGGNS